MGGQGSPVWLAGIIKEICEELDQVQGDVRCCGTLQYEVDFQASHSRRAVKAHSIVVSVSSVVIYGEYVGGDGLMTWDRSRRRDMGLRCPHIVREGGS